MTVNYIILLDAEFHNTDTLKKFKGLLFNNPNEIKEIIDNIKYSEKDESLYYPLGIFTNLVNSGDFNDLEKYYIHFTSVTMI